VRRVPDALVEGGVAAYEDISSHLRLWADALHAEVGRADLQGTSAMLDRVYRALEMPTA
jgi:hypothetical protein